MHIKMRGFYYAEKNKEIGRLKTFVLSFLMNNEFLREHLSDALRCKVDDRQSYLKNSATSLLAFNNVNAYCGPYMYFGVELGLLNGY